MRDATESRPTTVLKSIETIEPSTLLAAGVVLLVGLAATGGAISPLAPLLSLWMLLAGLRLPARAAATAGTAALLLVPGLARLWSGLTPTPGDVVRLLAIAATGAFAAMLVRTLERGSGARRAWLEQILAEASRTPLVAAEPAAAARIDALERVLADAAAAARARRATLWEVAGEPATATLRAASSGRVRQASLQLFGSPLGWMWHEAASLRFDAGPPITERGTVPVQALVVGRDADRGAILVLEFEAGREPPAADALGGIVAGVAWIIALQDEQALTTAYRMRLEAVVDALRRLPASLDPAALAATLAADTARVASADGAAVALWDGEAGRVVAVHGDDVAGALGATFGSPESELALAARAGATLVRENRDPRGRPPAVLVPGEAWTRPPRALACIPLIVSGETIAVLAFWFVRHTRFTPDAVAMLEALTPHAALHLARALEHDRVRETAEQDALTGLANRRVFDRALAAEAGRHERYGHPLCVIAIDIDHFKAVNDRCGHDAGDAVLRAVARTLKRGVRDVDTVARFGGEEFIVLLPETGLDAGFEVAERLRMAVAASRIAWQGEWLDVRISAGVACVPDTVRDTGTLLRSADAALYRAKRDGRDRVVRAGRPPDDRVAPGPAPDGSTGRSPATPPREGR
jgi:diguanylate cyclase (GGDEF)-like protein